MAQPTVTITWICSDGGVEIELLACLLAFLQVLLSIIINLMHHCGHKAALIGCIDGVGVNQVRGNITLQLVL